MDSVKENKVIFESRDGRRKAWVIPDDKRFNKMIEDFKDRLNALRKVHGWVD